MRYLLLLAALVLFGQNSFSSRGPEDQAKHIWKTLNGTNLPASSDTAKKITNLVDMEDLKKAALLAARSPESSTITGAVRRIFAPIAGREVNPSEPPGDFVLTWMIAALNDISVEDLFLTDIRFSTTKSNSVSQNILNISNFLDFNVSDGQLKEALRRNKIQNYKQEYISDPGHRLGVFSSLQYGQSIFLAGTNRRPLKKIAEDYLCIPTIEKLMNFSINDRRVGRDIPRAPGNDPGVYLSRCMGCHAGIDAARGAFAGYDMVNDTLTWGVGVKDKMNNDAHVFKAGHFVIDHSWEHTGWLPIAPEKVGQTYIGPRPLMEMLVESPQFYRCLVRRTQEALCPKTNPTELTLSQVAYDFESSQEIIDMMADVTVKICLTDGVQP